MLDLPLSVYTVQSYNMVCNYLILINKLVIGFIMEVLSVHR